VPGPFDQPLPPEAWAPATRAARKLVSPLQRILAIEAASGLLLIAATAVALVWANSPWRSAYDDLWHSALGIQVGSWSFVRPLHFWINDGLMTIFFFVVGLEIRREIYEGELAGLRRAALPLAAALGGMLVPAAIFVALNAGRGGAAGWAIPMATDIAFAVGVLTLLGNRVPASWRILLLALAVIDDIGAIVVIAVFYSDGIAISGLLTMALGMALLVGLRGVGVRATAAFLVPGAIVWAGLYAAGIHPTLAGVLVGLSTPVRSWFGRSGFAATTKEHLDGLDGIDNEVSLLDRLAAIEQARREAVSPAERLLNLLHPWVAFGVMPIFALANAGVALGGADLAGDGLFLFLGIVLGLAIGKPHGIFGASAIAVRAGIATRPADVSHGGVVLVGIVGGIGFTMSIFVAQLAFPPGPLLDTAKLAILVGSGAAIAIGLVAGLAFIRRPT
jgi:NhaA family Na+:H+ antiporter